MTNIETLIQLLNRDINFDPHLLIAARAASKEYDTAVHRVESLACILLGDYIELVENDIISDEDSWAHKAESWTANKDSALRALEAIGVDGETILQQLHDENKGLDEDEHDPDELPLDGTDHVPTVKQAKAMFAALDESAFKAQYRSETDRLRKSTLHQDGE